MVVASPRSRDNVEMISSQEEQVPPLAPAPVRTTAGSSGLEAQDSVDLSAPENVTLLPEGYLGATESINLSFPCCQLEQAKQGLKALGVKLAKSFKRRNEIRKLKKDANKCKRKIELEHEKLAALMEKITEKEESLKREEEEEEDLPVRNEQLDTIPKCPVCKLVAPETVLIPCGHTVCAECEEIWGRVTYARLVHKEKLARTN